MKTVPRLLVLVLLASPALSIPSHSSYSHSGSLLASTVFLLEEPSFPYFDSNNNVMVTYTNCFCIIPRTFSALFINRSPETLRQATIWILLLARK